MFRRRGGGVLSRGCQSLTPHGIVPSANGRTYFPGVPFFGAGPAACSTRLLEARIVTQSVKRGMQSEDGTGDEEFARIIDLLLNLIECFRVPLEQDIQARLAAQWRTRAGGAAELPKGPACLLGLLRLRPNSACAYAFRSDRNEVDLGPATWPGAAPSRSQDTPPLIAGGSFGLDQPSFEPCRPRPPLAR